MSHPPRSIVALSRDPERAELLDALADAGDYDVIFVESVAHGYSRIKQVMPDLIIVYVDIEDVAVCQLLSMLSIDDDLSMSKQRSVGLVMDRLVMDQEFRTGLIVELLEALTDFVRSSGSCRTMSRCSVRRTEFFEGSSIS